MRTFSPVAVATLLMTGSALAADVSAPSAHDWSGFYIGANAGAAWSNAEIDSHFENTVAPDKRAAADALQASLGDDDAVFTGGGIAGFNWQIDNIVLGVEADINYLGFGDEVNKTYITLDTPNPPGPPIVVSDEYSHLDWNADWYGTIRARLGFAVDNLLIYGTGGVAYGDVQASGKFYTDNFTYLKGSVDEVQWGWTAGAGAEYALSDSFSIGAEYLYVDLGSTDFNYKEINTTGFAAEAEVDYSFSVARATLKFSF